MKCGQLGYPSHRSVVIIKWDHSSKLLSIVSGLWLSNSKYLPLFLHSLARNEKPIELLPMNGKWAKTKTGDFIEIPSWWCMFRLSDCSEPEEHKLHFQSSLEFSPFKGLSMNTQPQCSFLAYSIIFPFFSAFYMNNMKTEMSCHT